jgi:hypothetical protein
MLPEKCVSSWLRWNPEWTIQSGVHQLIGGGTILAVAGNATGCTTGAATTSGSGFGATTGATSFFQGRAKLLKTNRCLVRVTKLVRQPGQFLGNFSQEIKNQGLSIEEHFSVEQDIFEAMVLKQFNASLAGCGTVFFQPHQQKFILNAHPANK